MEVHIYKCAIQCASSFQLDKAFFFSFFFETRYLGSGSNQNWMWMWSTTPKMLTT